MFYRDNYSPHHTISDDGLVSDYLIDPHNKVHLRCDIICCSGLYLLNKAKQLIIHVVVLSLFFVNFVISFYCFQ